MNTRSAFKHGFKRTIGLLLTLFMIALSPGAIARAAGSGGLVTLTVTVTGLPDNSGIDITAEKEIDGVLTFYYKTTDINGIAVFKIPFGGTVRVIGEPISGYLTPEATISLTQLKGNLQKSLTLHYVESQTIIPVTGITVLPEAASLFIGQEVQLSNVVYPLNATDKTVIWASDLPEIASVSDGLVTALSGGTAEVSATTVDGSYVDSSIITVMVIESITDPTAKDAAPGSVTRLPETVIANLAGGGTYVADVTWTLPPDALYASISLVDGIQYLTLTLDAVGPYELTGDVDFTELNATLDVTVSATPVIPINSAYLSEDSLSLYIGLDRDIATLTLTVEPTDADTSSLLWNSSNESAVQILSIAEDKKSAVIKGIANGTSIISVTLPGSPEVVLDTCTANVAADPLLTDPAYIVATLENDPTPVDQFANRYEVWIRCYDLPDGKYFIRVTDKGSGQPLGTGDVEVAGVDPDLDGVTEFKYSLYTETAFSLTNNYSASYFIEMSMDPTFPSGDDEVTLLPKTFVDNFKITSPVPTGQIVVNVYEVIGGNVSIPSEHIVGMHVILCRETDLGTAAEYEDYLIGYNEGHPLFSDEAKLIGHVQSGGSVLWDIPKEKLKIGGYILLMELPGGYVSNLNQVNPDPNEEGLLKEVHILRNTVVYREIIVSNQGTP